MKRPILSLFLIFIVIGLVISGCSQSTTQPPATSTTSTMTSTSTTAAPEVIELKLSHAFPPPSALGVKLEDWAKSIGEQTNGRVHITVYGGGTLVKSAEWFDAAVSGVTDIAYGHPSEDLSRGALETAFGLPGIAWPEEWPDVTSRIKIQEQIRQEFPEIAQAQQGAYRLYDGLMPPYVLQTASKEVRVPADMKGMKVAATGFYATVADILEAVPVTVSAPDRYMALERGTIDGSWDIWGGIKAMKHYEVSKYYLEGPPFGSGMAEIVMNEAKLNSLPSDIQQIFRSQRVPVTDSFHKESFALEVGPGRQAAEEHGGVLVTPTAEEQKLWNDALKPSQEKWVEEISAMGFPAQKFLDRLLQLIEENK